MGVPGNGRTSLTTPPGRSVDGVNSRAEVRDFLDQAAQAFFGDRDTLTIRLVPNL
jgi:hypothetical protein